MAAADRSWKSVAYRIIARFRDLGRPSSRRVDTEQHETISRDTLMPRADCTNLEFVHLVHVVHEVRNELLVMMLCAKAIRDGIPDAQAHKVSELQQSLQRAMSLINEPLVGERTQPSQHRLIDVKEVIRAATETLSPIQPNAICMQLDVSPEPLKVLAEPGALERLLLNLLLNAFDAMPEGGELTISSAAAEPGGPNEGLPRGPYARLTIRDTGHGMTAEVKERIFDPFFTTKKGGTGLGLRAVAFTVQQLHGRISVDSEPGRGTSVTILLPLAPEPPS
jgi:signal transduction histidine kinase